MPAATTTADPVLDLPPEGMLRISKAGERDQFVFPVHAERWAASGWTVHPPVTVAAGVMPPAGPLPVAALPELQPGVLPEQPVTAVGVVEVAPAEQEPMDYSALTKAQIVAEVEARYGVVLDASQTKSELVAQAQALEAETQGSGTLGAGTLLVESLVPQDTAMAPEPVPGLDAPAPEPDLTIPGDLLG